MKQIFLIFTLCSSIFAKQIISNFEIFFPLFGKIGEANASLVIKDKSYEIEIVANSFGVAKFMSSEKFEKYVSRGFVENNLLVPNYFKSFSKNSYKSRTKEYFFNHDKKIISMKKESFRYEKLKSSSDENLTFYAKNDLTTLYFNLKNIVNRDKFLYETVKTAGAEKDDGNVEVFKISNQELKEIEQLFDKLEDRVIKVVINQKIFASDKGELYLNLDKNYICKEAILKDVVLFGDIKAKLVNFKETNE